MTPRNAPWFVALAVAGLLPAAAAAAPGDLDQTFSGDGVIRGPKPKSVSMGGATSVAVDRGGAVVVVGHTGDPGRPNPAIVRYTSRGKVDRSFSGDGAAAVKFAGGIFVDDVEIDERGRVLLAGSARHGSNDADLAIIRLRRNGRLDASFGADGIVESEAGGFASSGDVTVDADGRIVALAGGALTVARLLATGAPDPTFSGDGLVELTGSIGGGAVATRPDGSVLVTGSGPPDPSSDEGLYASRLSIHALQANGEPDPSFGQDGRTLSDAGGAEAGGSIALDPSGRIVIGASICDVLSGCGWPILRFSPTGEHDPSFFNSGRHATTAGSVAVAGDGSVLVASSRADDSLPTFAVSQLDDDGGFDRGFGRNGTAGAYFGLARGFAEDVVVAPDGKVVVAGRTRRADGSFHAVARFEVARGPADADADGRVDRRDRCPRTHGPKPSGCPVVERHLSIARHGAQTIGGRLRARLGTCVFGQRIRILTPQTGRDRKIGTTRLQDDNRWRLKVPRAVERAYALAPGRVADHFVRCRRVRSRMIGV